MLENKHGNGYATERQVALPPHELVIASLDEALRVHPLYRKRLLDMFREDAANAGRNSSFKTWLRRYGDWITPERRHYPPPVLYTRVIEIVGHADFLDPWLGLAHREQLRRRREAENGDPSRYVRAR